LGILVVFLICVALVDSAWRPVVLMHGITGYAAQLNHVVDVLKTAFPGIYVHNVEIGPDDPRFNSIFWGIEDQIKDFCRQVEQDPKLKNGFNLIGFSQGGFIGRGYLEQCNKPPVVNFISWIGPQNGQFGVPNLDNFTSDILDTLLDCCVYDSWMQDTIAFCGYWRDPFDLNDYLKRCRVLPDLNNERTTKNATYKKNILSVKNFLMGWSTVDHVLKPRETGWFGVFAPNQQEQVIPLEEQEMYKKDWIGLRTLNEDGRLKRFVSHIPHDDYTSPKFDKLFYQHVIPLLNETIADD